MSTDVARELTIDRLKEELVAQLWGGIGNAEIKAAEMMPWLLALVNEAYSLGYQNAMSVIRGVVKMANAELPGHMPSPEHTAAVASPVERGTVRG